MCEGMGSRGVLGDEGYGLLRRGYVVGYVFSALDAVRLEHIVDRLDVRSRGAWTDASKAKREVSLAKLCEMAEAGTTCAATVHCLLNALIRIDFSVSCFKIQSFSNIYCNTNHILKNKNWKWQRSFIPLNRSRYRKIFPRY